LFAEVSHARHGDFPGHDAVAIALVNYIPVAVGEDDAHREALGCFDSADSADAAAGAADFDSGGAADSAVPLEALDEMHTALVLRSNMV